MYAAMSFVKPSVVRAVENLGLDCVELPPFCGNSDNAESAHADMQILSIGSDIFLIGNNDRFNNTIRSLTDSRIFYTDRTITQFRYPECVLLNAAVIGKRAAANFRYCDPALKTYFLDRGYELVNVAQGYTKCSTAVVSDNAAVTSDKSVASALEASSVDVLSISEGNIGLCERYGGFIGGASFLLGGTLYFTGDISKHPDGDRIRSFCKSHGVEVRSLTSEPLFDIGGVVIF